MTHIDPLHRNIASASELPRTPFEQVVQRALQQGSQRSLYCRSCGRLLHSDGELRFGLCDEHRNVGDDEWIGWRSRDE